MAQSPPRTAADEADFKRLWANAFAVYEKETGRNLRNGKELRDLKTVDDLISTIEAEGGRFTSWRNKHSRLWSRLSTCFKPIVSIGSLATSALSSTPFFAASAVLGAVLHLVKASENVADAYDWIETVFGELQEFADRLNLYIKIELEAVLEKKIAAILAFFLKILGRSEKLVSRGSFRHYLRVVFLGNDAKTRKLLDELNDSLKNEQSYVIAATYGDGKYVLDRVGNIEQVTSSNARTLQDIHGALDGFANREITKEDDDLIQHHLDSPAVERVLELFAEFRKRLLSGTGTWLERETLFTAWSEQDVPILWIFGGPGSGKSHLSTWAINHLEKLYVHDQGIPDVAVAFFYVRDNEAQLRDANTILKSLAWQIAHVDPAFKKHAAQVCKSKKRMITPEETWKNLFLEFYRPTRSANRSTILVIDGLDEAPKSARTTILGLCQDLLVQDSNGLGPRIQVAIIGRITLKGDMEFEREERFIEVSPEKNKDDIERYIDKRLSELELIKKLEQLDKSQAQKPPRQQAKPMAPTVRKRLKDKILSSANGIFLWAQLLMDQIRGKEAHEIEKILNSPPQSLEEMFRHIFERLAAEEDDLHTIRRLLSWMAYARRPLYFGEIDLILSLPSRLPNLLLWDAFRGNFASIFHLDFPEGYIKDADENRRGSALSQNGLGDEPGYQAEGSCATTLHRPSEGGMHRNDDENDPGSETVDANDDESSSAEESDSDGEDRPFSLLGTSTDGSLDAPTSTAPSTEFGTIHAYSDFQLRTVITFSHQQVRDFLVPQQDRAPMALDIDNKRSQVDITITCLDMLQLGNAEQRRSRFLADYPSRNFIHHLELVDRTAIEPEDVRRIIEGLYWYFHELAGARALAFAPPDGNSDAWDDYWTTWIATDKYSKLVRSWFEHGDILRNSRDDEAVAWMKAAALSAKQLFRPWVENLARVWLEKTGFDDETYLDKCETIIWLMHGLSSLDEAGNVGENLKDFAYCQLDFSQLPVERIEHLASFAPIKDTLTGTQD